MTKTFLVLPWQDLNISLTNQRASEVPEQIDCGGRFQRGVPVVRMKPIAFVFDLLEY